MMTILAYSHEIEDIYEAESAKGKEEKKSSH